MRSSGRLSANVMACSKARPMEAYMYVHVPCTWCPTFLYASVLFVSCVYLDGGMGGGG